MTSATMTISAYTPVQLNQEHEEHVRRIDSIMQMVSEDYDNINNAIPLFEQLESGS